MPTIKVSARKEFSRYFIHIDIEKKKKTRIRYAVKNLKELGEDRNVTGSQK